MSIMDRFLKFIRVPCEDADPSAAKLKGFSFMVAVCFTINYIIGSGILALPWAFAKTGILLGVIVMVFAGFLTTTSILFILETMARAEYMHSNASNLWFIESTIIMRSRESTKAGYESIATDDEGSGIEMRTSTNASSDPESGGSVTTPGYNEDIADVNTEGPLLVKENRFEIPELCEDFLGMVGKGIYTFSVTIYIYGSLWAFTTVFANALAALYDLGEYSYEIWLLMFAAMVVPLSLMELTEQVYVQVTMTIWRVVMVVLMVGTILVALFTGDKAFADYNFDPKTPTSLTLVAPWKLDILFPLAAYVSIFHHSVPALADPVENKRSLGWIFAVSVSICILSDIIVAAAVSFYFGIHTYQASNVAWRSYVGSGEGAVVAYIISRFVVLFPAFDVASAYPLNAITLGNNLMTTWYGGDAVRKAYKSRKRRSVFRAIACVPTLFASYYVRELGVIADITGIAGFVIAFIIPPMLSYYSEKLLRQNGKPSMTKHTSVLTSLPVKVTSVIVGTALLCKCILGYVI